MCVEKNLAAKQPNRQKEKSNEHKETQKRLVFLKNLQLFGKKNKWILKLFDFV